MSVGTKIRRLRLQNKWSQEELAHKLNVVELTTFENREIEGGFIPLVIIGAALLLTSCVPCKERP